MYGVVRRYDGDPKVLRDFAQRVQGVVEELRQIPGFVSYDVVVTGETLISLSIYEDQAGADASTELSRKYAFNEWTDLKLNPAEVTSGEIVVHAAR